MIYRRLHAHISFQQWIVLSVLLEFSQVIHMLIVFTHRLFTDIPLLPSMSPAERQDQDDRLDYEYIDDGEYRNGNLDGKNPDNHTKDCDTTLEENPGTLKDALRGLMS